MILDDPVQHYPETTAGVLMGMSVLFSDAAVRGPPCVSDPRGDGLPSRRRDEPLLRCG